LIARTSTGIDQEIVMANRATNLPPERRQALEAELRLLAELEARATLDKYVHVSRAYDAGMTTRDMAPVFGVKSSTISRWKDAGEKERERRRSGDPDRPREPDPSG
jgi:hypothetical protein